MLSNKVDDTFVNSFFSDETDQIAAPIVENENDDKKPTPEVGSVFKQEPDDDTPINDLLGIKDEQPPIVENDNVIPTNSTTTVKPTNNSGLTDMVSELIKEGVLFGFEGEDIKINSAKELRELIEANKEEWKREVQEVELQEERESLPDDVKYVIDYVKSGGTDLKGLFSALSRTQEISNMNPGDDSSEIVRTYLTYTKFGSPEEIEEQLKEWEDLELLEKKATLFQPKLSKLQEEVVKEKLKEQEEIREYQKQLAQQYYKGVDEALKDKNLNGIAITKDEQGLVYNSLTQNNYVSSRTGQPINFLGKFLEKITWDEPDYKMLAELTLFARDPNAYKAKIRSSAKEEEVSATVRKLKTGQGSLQPTTTSTDAEGEKFTAPKRTITRNSILRK